MSLPRPLIRLGHLMIAVALVAVSMCVVRWILQSLPPGPGRDYGRPSTFPVAILDRHGPVVELHPECRARDGRTVGGQAAPRHLPTT